MQKRLGAAHEYRTAAARVRDQSCRCPKLDRSARRFKRETQFFGKKESGTKRDGPLTRDFQFIALDARFFRRAKRYDGASGATQAPLHLHYPSHSEPGLYLTPFAIERSERARPALPAVVHGEWSVRAWQSIALDWLSSVSSPRGRVEWCRVCVRSTHNLCYSA